MKLDNFTGFFKNHPTDTVMNDLKTEKSDTNFENVGFPKRLFAYNIDMTILMLPCVAVSFLIESNSILFVVCVIIVCLYHAILESSEYQGTLGKKYSHIKVVDKHGLPLGFPQALLRILLKFISLLLLFSGFFIIFFRKDRKGLHDMIAKTSVVSDAAYVPS